LLREELKESGTRLFRWRSYFPVVLLLAVLLLDYIAAPRRSSLSQNLGWDFVCLGIALVGLGIRAATIGCVPQGTSVRSTKAQQAETLNSSGMYSVVRHPLYLGNFLVWIGLSLILADWVVTLIVILAFWLTHERIMMSEEGFLEQKFGPQFCEWATATPAFVPRFGQWRPPNLSFSLRNVLKREYSGFFAIVCGFVALRTWAIYLATGEWQFDRVSQVIFGVGVIVYLALMILKKSTSVLNVEGR
jgi:protein-S-isoprenylcysteine O-methyltransferase Ste14